MFRQENIDTNITKEKKRQKCSGEPEGQEGKHNG